MTEAATSQNGQSSSGQAQLPLGGNAAPAAASSQAQQATQASGGQQQFQQTAQSQVAQRYEWVPETDWDAEKGVVKPEFAQKVKDAFAFKAEADVRKASLPKTPDDYEVGLPADFKLPQGLDKFEFNKDDPVLKQARELALQRGLDKDSFKDFLGVYAANKIAEMTTINNARQAEIAKLGTAGPARIDAVRTWTSAKLGPELAGAIDQMLVTAKHVEAFEKIVDLFSRQGGTQFSQSHREQQEQAGKIPGYEQMSFKDRRLAQMKQGAAAGGR